MLKSSEHLLELAISETGLIFDPSSGFIYTVNPVAISIIKALQQGDEPTEIRARLCAEYQIESEVIERDLFDFFKQLSDYGMVSYEKN